MVFETLTEFEKIVVYIGLFVALIFTVYMGSIFWSWLFPKSSEPKLSKKELLEQQLKQLEVEGQKIIDKTKKKSITMKADKVAKSKPEPEPDSESKNAVMFQKVRLFHPMTWISMKLWKNTFIDKFKLHKAALIHMELINGNWRSFLVVPDRGGFRYDGKFYALDPDPDMKRYNMDVKHYQFWYHEAYSLPIRYKLPVETVHKLFTEGEAKEIQLSTNPSVLRKLIDADMAQGVLSGTELHAFFKRVQVMLFVVLLIVAVTFLLFLWQSGLLDNLAQIGQSGG